MTNKSSVILETLELVVLEALELVRAFRASRSIKSADPLNAALNKLAAGIRQAAPEEMSRDLVTETKAALALLAALDDGTDIIATKLAARRPKLN